MSQTIDDRIVSLEFENDQFEKGVATSLKTLENLKKSMKMEDAAKNLSGLSDVASKVDLSGVGKAIDSAKDTAVTKLKGWKIALYSAVGNLFGGLFIDPIKQAVSGGIARAQNIADAKFKLEGLGVSWKKVSEDIDYAVNQTAFGMDAAANAAAQFAASGVQTGEDMKTALRAISGVASMSSSAYEDITPIFTKAAGSGKVMADELNRIAARGLNASAELAKYFNGILDGSIEVDDAMKKQVQSVTKGVKVTESDIRDFASHSKISFKMFANAMDNAFGEHAKDSNKTFSGALANMKAALSRVGQAFREPIMDAAVPAFNSLRLMINEIKKALTASGIYDIWTRLINFAGTKFTAAIDKVTASLSANMDNFTHIGNGLKNILYSIVMVIRTIGSAFSSVFGKSGDASKDTKSLSASFEDLTKHLVPTTESLAKLREGATKVFSVFKSIAPFLKTVFSTIGKSAKVLLSIVGTPILFVVYNLYRVVDALHNIAVNSNGIRDFFINLKSAIVSLIPGLNTTRGHLSTFGPIIENVIDHIKTFATIVKNVLLGGVGLAIAGVATAFDKLRNISLSGIINSLKTFVSSVKSIPQISLAIDNIKIIFSNLRSFFDIMLDSISAFFGKFRKESNDTSRSVTKDMSGIQKVIYTVTNVFKGLGAVLGGVVLGAFTLFNRAFSTLRNFKIQNVVNGFKNFIASVKELGLLKTLGNTFQNMGGVIGEVLLKIISKVQDFVKEIKDSGSIIDFLIDKLMSLGSTLSDFKNHISEALFGSSMTRGGGGNKLIDVIELIREKVTNLKTTVGAALQYIRDKGYLTKTLMILWLYAVMKSMLTFADSTKKVSTAMSEGKGIFSAFGKFGELMDALTGTIKFARNPMSALTEALKGWNEAYIEAHKKSPAENFAAMMKSMAIGVGVLAASLAVLYKVVDDVDKFKTIAVGMGIFVGAMIIVAGAMTILSAKVNKMDNSFYSSFAANMIGISVAMGILASAVKKLSDIPSDKIFQGVSTLVIIGMIYTTMQFLLSKIQKTGSGLLLQLKGLIGLGTKIAVASASFAMLATGLLLMVAAVKAIKNLKLASEAGAMDDLLAGLVYIGSIFVAVIVASKYCGAATKGLLQISGALALLGLAAFQIAVASIIMKVVNPKDLVKMGSVFAGVAIIFALVAKMVNGAEVNKALISLGIAFTFLANTVLKLILAAKLIEYVDPDGLTLAMTTLLGVVGMMSLLLVSASTLKNGQTWKPILAMLGGLTLIFGLLITLSIFVANPETFRNIISATVLLMLILVSYAEVLKGAGKINSSKGAGRILAMIAGLAAICAGLYFLLPYVNSTGDFLRIAGIAAVLDLTLLGLVKITESFLKFAKNNNLGTGKWVTKSLAALGVMIGAFVIVAGVLIAASRLSNWYEVATMAVALSGAILGLTFAAKVIIENTKKIKWNELGKAAASLGIMVAALGVMSLAFIGLTKLMSGSSIGDVGATILALYSIAGLMFVMGEVIKSVGKIKTDKLAKAAAVMGLILVAFVAVGAVIAILNFLVKDSTAALANSQIVALVVLELIGFSALIGEANKIMAKAIAAIPSLLLMTLVYAAVGLVVGALSLIGADAKTMLAKSQVVSLVVLELVALTALMGVLSGKAALAIGGLPALLGLTLVYAAVGLVLVALSIFSEDAKTLLAKSQIVSLVILELIALTALLGLLAPLAGRATVAMIPLTLMIVIFGILGLVIAAIGNLNFGEDINTKLETLKSVLWTLVEVMSILGMLSLGAAGELAGAASIFILAAALVPLATGLNALGSVPYENVANGLRVITSGLIVLVAAGISGAIAGAGFLVLAAGIAAIGVACMVAGTGVMVLTSGLMSLMGVLSIFANAVIGAASAAVEGFKEKFETIKNLPADIIDSLIGSLGGVIGKLSDVGKRMGGSIVTAFRNATGWHSPPEFIVKFFEDAGIAVNKNANGITDLFEGTGNNWGSALSKALGNKIGDLKNFDMSSLGNLLGMDFGNGMLAGAAPGMSGIETMLAELGFATNSLSEKQALLTKKMKEGKISTSDYAYQMKQLNQTSKESTSTMDALSQSLGGVGKSAKGAGSGVKDLQSMLQSTLESQMNIFSKFEAKSAMSKEELLNNMRSQIEGMTNWATQMQQLATMGIDKGLYQKLAEMGPQGAEYVGAFANMTAEELQQANVLWAQSLVLPGQVASMVSGSFNSIGTNVALGYANGITAEQQAAVNAAHVMAEETANEVDTFNDSHSPSRLYMQKGEWIDEGLAQGIDNLSHLPVNMIIMMANEMLSTARSKMSSDKYSPIGAGIVEGIQSGIDSRKDGIYSTLSEIADKVESTLRKALDVNSPSKRMIPIGSGITEGLAVGVEKGYSYLDNSLFTVSDMAVESMKLTVANIASTLANEIEDPVITPVLDLSKVQAGVRTLNNTISANQAVGARASFNNLQNGQLSGNGNIIFNQVNNSPKALSRIEIYRDTRNLFAQAKGALS